jgi:hypothetical protein
LPSVRVTLFDHQPHFRQFFSPREFFQESLKPFSQLLDRAWRCVVAEAALGLRTYDPHGHGAIVADLHCMLRAVPHVLEGRGGFP